MKKISVLFFAVLMMFASTTVFAEPKIGQGASELGLFTSIGAGESSVSGSTKKNKSTDLTLDVRYSYFVTDGFQIGVQLNGMGTTSWTETNGKKDSNSESTSTTTFIYLDAKYNFYSKGWTTIPYIGLGIGQASTKFQSAGSPESTGSGTATAVMLGLKNFITDTTSLNIELKGDSFKYTPSGANVQYTSSNTTLLLGLSAYF